MFLGTAVVGAFVLDGGNDPRLAVIPGHGLDSCQVSDMRADAVASDHEAGLHRRAVGKCHFGVCVACFQARCAEAVVDLDAKSLACAT
jgi:hypothetical protein